MDKEEQMSAQAEFDRLLPVSATVFSCVQRTTKTGVQQIIGQEHEIYQLVLKDLLALTKMFGALVTDFFEMRDGIMSGSLDAKDDDATSSSESWISRLVDRYSEQVTEFLEMATKLPQSVVQNMTLPQAMHALSTVMDLNFGGLEKNFAALWKRVPLLGRTDEPTAMDLENEEADEEASLSEPPLEASSPEPDTDSDTS